MIGAITGDVIGSRFEFNNRKDTQFRLFCKDSVPTDDSILTIAVADALLHAEGDLTRLEKSIPIYLHWYGNRYTGRGYGASFQRWLDGNLFEPYNSFGNGAAMRVSPVAWVAETLDSALEMSDIVTKCTHNHPLGLQGARDVVTAIFLARQGKTMKEIKDATHSLYEKDFRLDDIRDTYKFDETCQGTVPVALECFFESHSFEETIRNAIAIGGDSDTIACIAGSVAEAYYGGVPTFISCEALKRLPYQLRETTMKFCKKYGIKY